jgi:hypothetical protein
MQSEAPPGAPIIPFDPTGDSFFRWLTVLASPEALRSMRYMPPPGHFLRMLDGYLPYARSTRLRSSDPPLWFELNPQRREALALRMRALLEQWIPPRVPREIVDTARLLLLADIGCVPGAPHWEEMRPDARPSLMKTSLCWPKDLPRVFKEEWMYSRRCGRKKKRERASPRPLSF